MKAGDRVAYVDFRQEIYNSAPLGTIVEVEYTMDQYFYTIKWDGFPLNDEITYTAWQVAKIIMPGDKVDESFKDQLDGDINDADWWKNGPKE